MDSVFQSAKSLNKKNATKTKRRMRTSNDWKPNFKKGLWSNEEDNLLLDLVHQQLELNQNVVENDSSDTSVISSEQNVVLKSRSGRKVVGTLSANFATTTESVCSSSNDEIGENGNKRSKIDWTVVSEGLQTRSCKQCRERWVNHLNPSVTKEKWSNEEDEKLLELGNIFPKKWAQIAREMPGRSQNQVKIRWNSLHRNKGKSTNSKTSTASPRKSNRRRKRSNEDMEDDEDSVTTFASSAQSEKIRPVKRARRSRAASSAMKRIDSKKSIVSQAAMVGEISDDDFPDNSFSTPVQNSMFESIQTEPLFSEHNAMLEGFDLMNFPDEEEDHLLEPGSVPQAVGPYQDNYSAQFACTNNFGWNFMQQQFQQNPISLQNFGYTGVNGCLPATNSGNNNNGVPVEYFDDSVLQLLY